MTSEVATGWIRRNA